MQIKLFSPLQSYCYHAGTMLPCSMDKIITNVLALYAAFMLHSCYNEAYTEFILYHTAFMLEIISTFFRHTFNVTPPISAIH